MVKQERGRKEKSFVVFVVEDVLFCELSQGYVHNKRKRTREEFNHDTTTVILFEEKGERERQVLTIDTVQNCGWNVEGNSKKESSEEQKRTQITVE